MKTIRETDDFMNDLDSAKSIIDVRTRKLGWWLRQLRHEDCSAKTIEYLASSLWALRREDEPGALADLDAAALDIVARAELRHALYEEEDE